MIGISKLYCGAVEAADVLRYGRHSGCLPSHLLQFSEDKRPVVVWNVTRRCNLKCVHCYAQATATATEDELSLDQGLALLDDLKAFGVPVVLFSGGEPLMHPELLTLVEHAVTLGMRAVISTNGTLIDREMAGKLKTIRPFLRGDQPGRRWKQSMTASGVRAGAFAAAMEGVRNCQEAGIKVGLRFTINKHNYKEIPAIFDLIEEREIPRVCFYHLVYAGRGSRLVEAALSHEETRGVVDLIIDRTADLFDRGKPKEVLTVDNHADGPYIYLRLQRENNPRAEEVLQLLRMNEGNSSGRGIGCVSWDGQVHADQFWRHYAFGNVKERPFSQIWTDLSNPLMAKLKEKKKHVTGRCATCRWLDTCGGNFRVRAEALTGDLWAPDPDCYLTEAEIS